MTIEKYMMGLIVMFLFFKSVAAQPFEGSAKYQISVWGMNIGEFTVDQKIEGDDIRINAVTDVYVRMIFSYQVKYIQHSLYRHGILWSSQVKTLKNGKINSNTRLDRQTENYLLTKDGDATIINGDITYSGSLLYFQEPKQINCIYNERNGEKNTIKSLDDHTYAIADMKGSKTNIYEYQNGILIRAELIHTLATIHLKRIL
ncbi:MAG: hypothetical protein PHP53_20860 [Prolixibacteraceae bacterium]|nr:hypothetical protein [Prolixibacteraceae bacterium]